MYIPLYILHLFTHEQKCRGRRAWRLNLKTRRSDLFVSSVDFKFTLTNAQKFHYIVSILRDKAENIIQHVPVTSTAYKTTWQSLSDRF